MTQSYLGKRAISKGIGRLIPKFVLLASCARPGDVGGERSRGRWAKASIGTRSTPHPLTNHRASTVRLFLGSTIRDCKPLANLPPGKSKGLARVAQSYGEEADGFRLPWAGRGRPCEAVRFGSLMTPHERRWPGCSVQN
jgi:hypothetical protein